MAKVIQEYKKCIGCGSCAAICSEYWKMTDDGKAKPIGSKLNSNGNYELEVEQVGCNQEAAEACPVECIHVKP